MNNIFSKSAIILNSDRGENSASTLESNPTGTYADTIVKDKLCKNLGEVFASNIFQRLISILLTRMKGSHEGFDVDSLVDTIQKLEKKKDVFDGILIGEKEIDELRSFLYSLNGVDVTNIYKESITLDLKGWGKAKKEEKFLTLTDPNKIIERLRSDIQQKKGMFENKKSYNLHRPEGYQEIGKDLLTRKRDINVKVGEHKIVIFHIKDKGSERYERGYVMADNNHETLLYIGEKIKNIEALGKSNALVIGLEDDGGKKTRILTLDGREYSFAHLHVYKDSKGGNNNIKYMGVGMFDGNQIYFDEYFQEIKPKIKENSTGGTNGAENSTIHRAITIEENGRTISFKIRVGKSVGIEGIGGPWQNVLY